jgi:predicted nucleotidyltransferase
MNYLQKSILKTLAYWDGLDWPLTSFEIWRYLVNPRRLGLNAQSHYNLGEIIAALDSKELAKYIVPTSGFWHFRDRGSELARQRVARELLADQKWKQMKRRAKWLQMIPCVRLIMGSGSIAAGNVSDKSDWDLLVITAPNRIWTARALLHIFTTALGWRRKDDIQTQDKFCLNHYITEQSLLINLPSLYTAQLYAHLIPLCGEWQIYQNFQERNGWIRSYLSHWPMAFVPHTKSIEPSPVLNAIRQAGEFALNVKLGDWIEALLEKVQARKIASNPRTGAPGGRISYSGAALEFHPDSKERWIISRLNDRLREIGFPELADEKDSGLI